jgi:methylmalonyl-CoA/ethylmalonyl-CoA epimerase
MSFLEFHHLGLACRTFAAEQKALESVGYQMEGPLYDDPGLGIQCRFLISPEAKEAPRLELIVALPGSTVLDPWLQQGIKIYHMAFQTADLNQEIERLKASRAKVIIPPTPAVAFGGKRVSFVMLPNLLLSEFIEK